MATEAQVREAARRAGVRREDLPPDPDDALDLLGPTRGGRRRPQRPRPDPLTRNVRGRRRRRPVHSPPPDELVDGPPDKPTPSSSSTTRSSSRPADKRPAGRSRRAAPARRPTRRRRRPTAGARGALAAGTAAATRPVRRAVISGTTLAVGALGLVLLYQALTAADALATVIEAPAKALRWLADPTKSVPYAPAFPG